MCVCFLYKMSSVRHVNKSLQKLTRTPTNNKTREGQYTGGSGSGGGSGATRLSTDACAHVTSVTELKSHSSLPKHLPLHTRKSHLRRFIQRQILQFSLQRHHWLSRCYARKIDRKGKDVTRENSSLTTTTTTHPLTLAIREGQYTGGSGSGGGSDATRPSTYACAHVSSVTEPKSHSYLNTCPFTHGRVT